MVIGFFVHGVTLRDLSRAEFYAQDIAILTGLGHEVYWAKSLFEIKRSTDLIFCWWWTFALQAVWVAAIRHRPVVVTGVFDLPTFRDRPVYQQWAMGTAARRASANVF